MTQATPKGVILAVILILGIVTVGCVGGIIWLASTSTPIPSTLEVLAGTALGAVAGVLATTRTNPDPVAQVPEPVVGVPVVETPAPVATGGEFVPEPPAGTV